MCTIPVHKIRYFRTCKKCDFTEYLDHVPVEVENERKETAKQQEIKKLERKLEELKESK